MTLKPSVDEADLMDEMEVQPEDNAYIERLSHYVLEVELAQQGVLRNALRTAGLPFYAKPTGNQILVKKTDDKKLFALLRKLDAGKGIKVKRQVIGMATVEIQRLYIFFAAIFISALIMILTVLYLFDDIA